MTLAFRQHKLFPTLFALPMIVAGMLLATATAQSGPPSQFITLDAPDAGSIGTQAEFINQNGSVAGLYYDASQNRHGIFLPVGGTLVEFDPPGSTDTVPTAINNSNQIVGLAKINRKFVSFLRSGNGKYVILSLAGASDFRANAINDSKQIAGYYVDSSTNVAHSFIRQPDGSFTFFDEPDAGTLGTFVQAMNNSGAVTGYFYDAQTTIHGFVRDAAGNYSSFDAPQGIGSTSGTKINDAGSLIGIYGSFEVDGFERDALGTIQNVSVPGATDTVAFGINNLDVVVGVAEANSSQIAFRRTASGNYSALNIPPAHITSWGQDVNDSGVVTGFYQGPSGKNFGFVLKP